MESAARLTDMLEAASEPARCAAPRESVGLLTADPDAALVAAAQRGDRAAFASLVNRHQRHVYAYLRARLLDSSDAEDLCQEVFLRCYLGRERLSRAASIDAWLVGIARNLLREHVRRISRRREVAWTELCLELDQLIDAKNLREQDAVQHLPGCLESLGQSAREAIDLRYRSELSWGEIGKRLRRSEGAVKLLMHRARLALHNCLSRKLHATEHPR